MAESKVGKMKFGVTTFAPASNDAAGFSALTYTYPADCIITNIGQINHFWETQETTPTICHLDGTIDPPFKSAEKIDNFTITMKFSRTEVFVLLIEGNKNSSNAIMTAELTQEGGVHKIYLRLQFIKAAIVHGGTNDVITFDCEAIVTQLPIKS